MSPRSGAPPPRERPATDNSGRRHAARRIHDSPPDRHAAVDGSTMDASPPVPRRHRRRRCTDRLPRAPRQRDSSHCNGWPRRSQVNDSPTRRQLVEITNEALTREPDR
ncbi:MAG: hypothetical protein M3460_13370 [Actinomycetota bacterium]|nr:hypothetical protein [Actinomycetota bacterium]